MELLEALSPADLKWAAERWAMLSEESWNAAFTAGGYPPQIRDRYIWKLKEKIVQALEL